MKRLTICVILANLLLVFVVSANTRKINQQWLDNLRDNNKVEPVWHEFQLRKRNPVINLISSHEHIGYDETVDSIEHVTKIIHDDGTNLLIGWQNSDNSHRKLEH